MDPHVRRALASTVLARLAASAALRIVYPFLPAIARGLDVSPAQLASVVALRNLGAVSAPLAATAAERFGRRTVMIIGMVSVAAGCVLTVVTGRFWFAAAGILIVGFARPVLEVATQAWFADRVVYSQRGRVFGLGELNWSFSLLVVPLAGYLIAVTDWRAAFIVVVVLAVIGVGALARTISPDRPVHRSTAEFRFDARLARALATVALLNLAAEIIFVVYGQWLEASFGLSVTGIGAFTVVILLSEFAGAGWVALISDSFGLKRLWMLSMAVSAIVYVAFFVAGISLLVALTIVALWIVSFEMSFVASVPFISEMSAARERVISLVIVSVGVGRAVGAFIAQPIYSSGGIALSGGMAAVCMVLAIVVVATVPEHDAIPSPAAGP